MKKLISLLMLLCLICSATTVLCETPMQEIKVGKVTFQIPAGLTGGMYATDAFMEAHDYASEKYGITIASFDLAELENNQVFAEFLDLSRMGNEHSSGFYWALQLFAGCDTKLAKETVKGAKNVYVTSDGGATLINSKLKGFAMAGHTYRGTGFFLGTFVKNNSNISQSDLEAITLDIAASFRLEGVTEEEMAADAAAAAAQKYIVITNSSANIRAKADSKSDKITTAYQGDTFPLLGEEGTWYMIEVNGQPAYVSQGLCKIKE